MTKTTGELLKALKTEKTFESYFQKNIGEFDFTSLSQYLQSVLVNKKLKKKDVINKSNLNKDYVYPLFNGTKSSPSRNVAIMLAFGLELNLEETSKLLKIAQVNELYSRNLRDSIIMFSLEHRVSLLDTNEKLEANGMELLESGRHTDKLSV